MISHFSLPERPQLCSHHIIFQIDSHMPTQGQRLTQIPFLLQASCLSISAFINYWIWRRTPSSVIFKLVNTYLVTCLVLCQLYIDRFTWAERENHKWENASIRLAPMPNKPFPAQVTWVMDFITAFEIQLGYYPEIPPPRAQCYVKTKISILTEVFFFFCKKWCVSVLLKRFCSINTYLLDIKKIVIEKF